MEVTHLMALIPLIVFLILSLTMYGKLLVHFLTMGYDFTLAWFAIINQWEVMFFPICVFIGIIALILMMWSATKGDWL